MHAAPTLKGCCKIDDALQDARVACWSILDLATILYLSYKEGRHLVAGVGNPVEGPHSSRPPDPTTGLGCHHPRWANTVRDDGTLGGGVGRTR